MKIEISKMSKQKPLFWGARTEFKTLDVLDWFNHTPSYAKWEDSEAKMAD